MSGRARRATRPTACLFGRVGTRADCDRRKRSRVCGGLALRFAGTNLGKPTQSGGCTKPKHQDRAGDNEIRRESSADARDPTTGAQRAAAGAFDCGRQSRSIVRDRANRTFAEIGFLTFRHLAFVKIEFRQNRIFQSDLANFRLPLQRPQTPERLGRTLLVRNAKCNLRQTRLYLLGGQISHRV